MSAADLACWQQLAGAAAEPNPFFEPDYLLPLAGSLGSLGDVRMAVASDGPEWLACMPVYSIRGWHRIPLRGLIAWRGSGLLPALIGTPLLAGERLAEGSAALLEALWLDDGAAYLAFDGLVEDGPVHAAIGQAIGDGGFRSQTFSREQRAFSTRRVREDYLEQALGPKHRRNLRSQQRRLAEELGGEIEVIDRSGDPAAVAELIELERRSHLGARGTVLASDPAQATFFGEVCASFAARRRLQLLALQVGRRTLAMKCSLLADPGVFYLKIAYDEDFARFSPGIQLEVAALSLFHSREASEWIDSCAFPGNETFNRLLPERRSLLALTVARRSARGLAVIPMIGTARRLRDRAMRANG